MGQCLGLCKDPLVYTKQFVFICLACGSYNNIVFAEIIIIINGMFINADTFP